MSVASAQTPSLEPVVAGSALEHRMLRPRRMLIGGVAASLTDHLGWSRVGVRLLFVGTTLLGGAGTLLYLWLWALTPLDEPSSDESATTVRRRVPVATVAVVVAILAVASLCFALLLGSRLTTPSLLAVVAAAGFAVAWTLAFDRHDPARSERRSVVIRGIAATLLVVSGGILLLTDPTAVDAVLAVTTVLLGVAVLATPRLLRLWTGLQDARVDQVREAHRAEIAAHLHDSVLQTLALIQNRAGASSDVARIARAQERELRDWLFGADVPEVADLAAELREIAAAIELDLPARIDVVTAGRPVTRSNPALAAAAREAMLNAARHVGGDVSVYLERSATAVDVFVRDRGPGVDIATIPADRIGIRESIIGRMTRAGGTAEVRNGAGGLGTEVHLHLELVNGDDDD